MVLFLGVTILLASTYVTLSEQDSAAAKTLDVKGELDLDLDNPAVFKPPKMANHWKELVPGNNSILFH